MKIYIAKGDGYMKKIKLLICLMVMMQFASPIRVLAESDNSPILQVYIEGLYENSNEKNIKVFNFNGSDITNSFKNQIIDYYINKDYKSIQSIIHENKLTLVETKTEYSTCETNFLKGIKAVDTSKTETKYFYEIADNKTELGLRKEWNTELRGLIVYSELTGEIKSGQVWVSAINIDFGWNINVWQTNSSTSAPISSDKMSATIRGSYQLVGEYVDFAQRYNLDFGYINRSFTMYSD